MAAFSEDWPARTIVSLSPDEVSAELTAISAGPLPQSLSYLVANATRQHGRVHIAPTACVIHGDEPALLAELAAHRGLFPLRLRRLAPTALVSAAAPDQTLAALCNEGYAPSRKTPTEPYASRGSHLGGPPLFRRDGRPRQSRHWAASHRTAEASATLDAHTSAARLLNVPLTAPEPNPFGTDTEEIVAGYDPPYAEAWCHLRSAERVFTLSRIGQATHRSALQSENQTDRVLHPVQFARSKQPQLPSQPGLGHGVKVCAVHVRLVVLRQSGVRADRNMRDLRTGCASDQRDSHRGERLGDPIDCEDDDGVRSHWLRQCANPHLAAERRAWTHHCISSAAASSSSSGSTTPSGRGAPRSL